MAATAQVAYNTVRGLFKYECRAVGIGGWRGVRGGPCPHNNLHKYTVMLITKVCHFKKNYVCPPKRSVILKKNYVCPPPPPICNCFLRAWNASSFITFFTCMLRQMSYLSGKNYWSPLKWFQQMETLAIFLE